MIVLSESAKYEYTGINYTFPMIRLNFKRSGPRMSSDTRQTDKVYDVTSNRQTFMRHSAWCMCTGNALYTMAGE